MEIMPMLLEILPESEIINLQNIDYCRKLGLSGNQYPVISQSTMQGKNEPEGKRNYKKQVLGYWINSQWFDKGTNSENLLHWKRYLEYLARILE